MLLLKRAHRTTKSPYPGGDAAKSASWPRKLAESVGLIAAVFFANLLLGGFLAYTQTQFYEVGPDIVHQDSFLSHLESDVLSSAAQINSSVPTQIDEITVLERASAEGTTLVYHYNIESSASPRDIEAAMAPRIFQGVCSDITMTAAMRDGASFRYEYTNTRAELASVEISESNCHPEMPIIPNGASASLAPSPNHE
ncbi:hypothetical protein [Brevundimonas denitrificans]|uniref:hypothetical protein n=1 Tax=Brevundimonas denitrificans TaxID=1443434 RepID=UPI00223B3B1C|nr:hypothetical protein [Brevundimonas denitrificans]